MSAVVLLHPDRVKRERLAKALRARGLPILDAVSVEEGLEVAEGVPIRYVLVETSILLTETYAIETRFSLRNVGAAAVTVVALTHVAAMKEVSSFQKHGAILLPQPPENIDMLALLLGASPEALVPGAPTVEPSMLNAPPERLESEGKGSVNAPLKPDGTAPLCLVIDDDALIRELVVDILNGVGYRTHAVASAMAAIRFMQRHGGVDIMVSDINMPVFDGYELKDMLDYAHSSAPEGAVRIPFIVVTGEDTPEKYALAIRLGASGFVPKPIKSMKGFCRLIRASYERAVDDASRGV